MYLGILLTQYKSNIFTMLQTLCQAASGHGNGEKIIWPHPCAPATGAYMSLHAFFLRQNLQNAGCVRSFSTSLLISGEKGHILDMCGPVWSTKQLNCICPSLVWRYIKVFQYDRKAALLFFWAFLLIVTTNRGGGGYTFIVITFIWT